MCKQPVYHISFGIRHLAFGTRYHLVINKGKPPLAGALYVRPGSPPAADDVGVEAHGAQLSHGLLRGLGLLLPDAPQHRHQRDVDQGHAVSAYPELKLPQRLQEHGRLDVAYGAPDLCVCVSD